VLAIVLGSGAGCAGLVTDHEGRGAAFAVGDARVEWCPRTEYACEPNPPCSLVKGGTLSSNFGDVLAAAAAAFAAWFGGGIL
jgi:hypothetical protein